MSPRVAVIGLDCADPQLVFDRWSEDLPNFRALAERGAWGPLRSVDPPITVPAWSCMLSSRDPGELGIYGFRNRKDYTYDGMYTADSRAVEADRVFDILSRAGKHVIIQGIPGTWPPVEVNGEAISCFLTPDTRRDAYTHPPELRQEIEQVIGGAYNTDVLNFRSDDRDRILAEVYEMTGQHFEVSRHLLETREWDFFMSVEIGLDRIHHAFWRWMDESHRDYEAGHRYGDVIRSYYQYLDDEIGDLLEVLGDDTAVMVVSDHGGRAMEGAICVNEWLVQEGYLVLEEPVDGITPWREAKVDWSKTRAWGEGGYYCRLCLNIEGREPEGVVKPDEVEALKDELIEKLEAIEGPDGPIGTRVHRPEDLWRSQQRISPDLVVYFGDLGWRSAGSLGHANYWTFANDTGPDDANHAKDGMVIATGEGISAGRRDGMRLLDIAPTILDLMDVEIPADMQGRSLRG